MAEKQKIARLAELGTATVYEASGREGLIDLPLIQVVPKSRVAGPARTVLCGQGDNIMVHACIEHIQPGEIVVLAQPESQAAALLGDMLVTQMQVAGAAGILLNGSVRDFEELVELGLPIWTQFVRVRGATKDQVGRLNVPVALGGNIIYPGDIVVMDADGAITVRPSRLDEVLEKSEARAAKEEAMRARYRAGERSYDLRGWRDVVERPR
ncbi:MAG: 4-carboxy-4-hydroxy-2-oxoadipate aldolase/oxaloacetate decarboxylase [Anaerolineales bacterium]|nr:4-carboxy-4-hydroxy-2-oxoadipate aldolase/oxaloacetate decarboxylase [Anaerolineales bacterium]MCB0008542.1 4-carboxy-4-hydroxy-2-oxoadipate aldolase/oxaloacetate decarboxylase [Anaerolineales bacterium]MCB8959929.1 4-carboxy-4-hydroxy-2-oxoadipate aldolase/oxaloacetate decarboxylase [Ardenticatenales bacterium]